MWTIRLLREGHRVEIPATGGSMQPLFAPGDILTVEPASAADIVVDDIAVFLRDGGLVAHRVVSTTPLVTRGDGLRGRDVGVDPAQVIGRVIARERRRRMLSLTTRTGRSLSMLCRWIAPLYKVAADFVRPLYHV